MDLTLCDESAKASVGALILMQGHQQAELTVRRLCLGSPSASGHIQLRDNGGTLAPESFGDVFSQISPADLFDHSLGPAPVEVITCWSAGRLNYRRAPEMVLREVLAGVLDLSQIEKFIESRQASPQNDLNKVLIPLHLPALKSSSIQRLLTNQPDSYSLWIDYRTRQRSYWTFGVLNVNDSTGIRHFEW